MCHDYANNKRVAFAIIVLFVLSLLIINLSFDSNIKVIAASTSDENLEEEFSNNIENILNDIDSSDLDDYLTNDFNLDFLSVSSFKDLIVKILNGTYFDEYDSLFDAIKEIVKANVQNLLKVILVFLVLVILFEVFNNFCADKFSDLKNIIKIIFSFVIVLLLFQIFKEVSVIISETIEKMFSFSKILFPILLNLILLSGASGTYSVYSSLSLFLINTGTYIFTYYLLPISISIFVLSIFGSIFSNKRFSKIVDVFKTLFKYSIIIFFSLFGLFSSINLISAGAKDGVSLRLTKYAIKNYIPIVGGYVSQGFDFVHSCSIVIKNAFGVCGILAIIFIILKPLIIYFVYLFLFKILSAVVALVGNNYYSDLFDNVSKTMSYFVTVLVGLFFIIFVFIYLLIISVSVI